MVKHYLNQAEIAEATRDIGIKKTSGRSVNTFLLALMAGMFIAFASAGSTMASFNLLSSPETYGLGRALLGAYFAAGLMFVIIAGAELFTGNALIIVAVMDKKVALNKMFKNWGIVYIGNFIGSVVTAALICNTLLFNSGEGMYGGMLIRIAFGKVSLPFVNAFISGVLCNIIVCSAVWMSYAAVDIAGKCISIFFTISLFAMSGYEHSIANMSYISGALFAKLNPAWAAASGLSAQQLSNLNWGTFITNNLLPVTLGNIFGGMVVIGLGYWFVYMKNK